jgi:hypothetical protein
LGNPIIEKGTEKEKETVLAILYDALRKYAQ